MKQIRRIIYITTILTTSFTITSFANRYNPETQIGPLTEDDVQNIEADLAEQNYLSNQPSIEYDENTDSYYEDTYLKAKPGNWMNNDIGKWYQLETGNYYKNGWVRIDGKRYYFDENGYMKIGWIQVGNKWYYTDDKGIMVTGELRIDGVIYNFNAYGIMQK
jgi:glucan-binding YG repeat protein